MFILKAELAKLNATQIPSTLQFSTYFMSMNKLIKQLNVALKKKIDELQNTLLNQSTQMKHYKQEPESERNLLKNFTQ